MKKKTKMALCAASIIGVVGISGAFAYLTDTETANNTFTVGKVDIELQEPSWVETNAQDMAANATIAKDPQVKNVGVNDAYVYLKVTVPVETVITTQADGTRNTEAPTQLFTYVVNEGWSEITSAKEQNLTDGSGTYTYVYYYERAIAANETTPTLFDEVTFANVIEGEVDTTTQTITVDAYAIQSENLTEGTSIEAAYGIYVNQNS